MNDYFIALSVITIGCAFGAWLACRFRQPVILGYFLCGVVCGPYGLDVIGRLTFLSHLSRVGVTLLLFLAGMVLHPNRLQKHFSAAMTVTLSGCFLSWILVFLILSFSGVSPVESDYAALALMFSSTILVVKLLPTTTLHQLRMGSLCIAILIAQDIIAVIVLLFLRVGGDHSIWYWCLSLPVKTIGLTAALIAGEQHLLRPMMRKSDRFNEVLIMLCLAWCLGGALAADALDLPSEVGAFIAGLSIARGKIALYLTEQLKPLRDFFLMFFFFVLGARFTVAPSAGIIIPAAILTVGILVLRPLVMAVLFRATGEEPPFARESGIRLGQASEFALIIAAAALAHNRISADVAGIVQIVTILTMLVSSYIVVFRYPTPIGVQDRLHRD